MFIHYWNYISKNNNIEFILYWRHVAYALLFLPNIYPLISEPLQVNSGEARDPSEEGNAVNPSVVHFF